MKNKTKYMKQRFMQWMAGQKWIYALAVKLIANRIVHCQNILTPKYLIDRGWIEKDGYFIEPNLKERDTIWIKFEHHYFRVYHGAQQTFIALESKIEWFENYHLLAHGDNGRYRLAGI